MKHNILLVTKNVVFHLYLFTWIAWCCFIVIMHLFWQQPVKNTRQTFMNWPGGLLFDREILSELLQKSFACPRRCFVRGVRIQESRWTGFHIHSFMVRVFDCFDRGSFTVLLQLLIVTDRQQTDVFVKFRHLTHERCHSSRKQVCKFCVSGGSSGPEGRLEIGALSLNGMERGELTMIDVQEIAGGGARKVETKEGTENNCLPWGAEDDGGGWVAPEAKTFTMRWCLRNSNHSLSFLERSNGWSARRGSEIAISCQGQLHSIDHRGQKGQTYLTIQSGQRWDLSLRGCDWNRSWGLGSRGLRRLGKEASRHAVVFLTSGHHREKCRKIEQGNSKHAKIWLYEWLQASKQNAFVNHEMPMLIICGLPKPGN